MRSFANVQQALCLHTIWRPCFQYCSSVLIDQEAKSVRKKTSAWVMRRQPEGVSEGRNETLGCPGVDFESR